jgi:hypothetical protein
MKLKLLAVGLFFAITGCSKNETVTGQTVNLIKDSLIIDLKTANIFNDKHFYPLVDTLLNSVISTTTFSLSKKENATYESSDTSNFFWYPQSRGGVNSNVFSNRNTLLTDGWCISKMSKPMYVVTWIQ